MLMSAFDPKRTLAMSFSSADSRMKLVLSLVFVTAGPDALAQSQPLPEASVKSSVAIDGLMTRERGLIIAREFAKSEGRDLTKYELDTFGHDFGSELTEDRAEWMFVFLCKPIGPPGCQFMVVVDRRTGKAQLIRGE